MTTEQSTKVDIWHNGRSHAVRLPVQIWTAFKALAADRDQTIGALASIAQREHNGTLAEAITAYVEKHSSDVVLYGTRETWIGKAVELMRPIFAERGHPLPEKIRATIAFTSKGWKGKTRGECWNDVMSADGATEVMICLRESDTTRIVNILCHELCHAAQFRRAKESGKPIEKGAGHGKTFAVVAEALDLLPEHKTSEKTGKTRVVWDRALGDPAGKWGEWAQVIIDALGKCPHAAIAEAWAKKEAETPKQTTRMLKFEHENCPESEDGISYVWRASSKSVADKPRVFCPCCGAHIPNPHHEDAGEEGETVESDKTRKDSRTTVRKLDKVVPVIGKIGRKSVVQDMLDKAVADNDYVTARRLRDQQRDDRRRT